MMGADVSFRIMAGRPRSPYRPGMGTDPPYLDDRAPNWTVTAFFPLAVLVHDEHGRARTWSRP